MTEEQEAVHVVLSNEAGEEADTCPSCGLAFERNEDPIPVWVGEPTGEPSTYVHEHCSETTLGHTPPKIVLWDSRTPSIRGAIAEAIQDISPETDDVVFVIVMSLLVLLMFAAAVMGEIGV